MNKRSVIIDCGSRRHDELTVIWALSDTRLDVKAITCTAETANNVQNILTMAGATHIPVAQGVAMSAIELMAKEIEAAEQPVTICVSGPLTNVALLFAARPDLIGKVELVAVAGGGAGRGDVTPTAEHNIHADPEAAAKVVQSGAALMMGGLDVAGKAYFTAEETKAIRGKGTDLAVAAADILEGFSNDNGDSEDWAAGIMQGPCVVTALTEPDMFQSIYTHVDIETAGDLTRGMTIINQVAFLDMPENATVLLNVDRSRFVERFMSAMELN